MIVRRPRVPLAILLLCAWADHAAAQSAPTCSFDPATAAVTVTVNGQGAELRAPVGTGEILLDGVSCGGATVFNTDAIQVNGSGFADAVTLAGKFAPGLTPEADGSSEIEIAFALGDGSDHVILNLTRNRDVLTFTSDGIDVGNDLDRDILTAGVEYITIRARDGNDRIDASAYTSMPPDGFTGLIELHGGTGQDTLIGSSVLQNWLHGDEDADRIYGGGVGDSLFGGPGDDLLIGRGGDDIFYTENSTADGADDMRGGDGADQVTYRGRANGVTVTIGNGLADDGESGEGDNVSGDVEVVEGGHGPDVLVGTNAPNQLYGLQGDDELYGGGGNDILYGSLGNDIIIGDDGDDTLDGSHGDDFLDGGAGRDSFFGEYDNDTIYNADGVAEWVDCGAGTADDAEPDPLDTFTGCEL